MHESSRILSILHCVPNKCAKTLWFIATPPPLFLISRKNASRTRDDGEASLLGGGDADGLGVCNGTLHRLRDAGRCGSIAGHIGAGGASLLEAGDGGDSEGFATTESRWESCQHACGVWAGTCGACLCACHLGLRCRLCRLCSRCPLLPHEGPAPALTKSADGGVRVVAHEWTVLCTYCG